MPEQIHPYESWENQRKTDHRGSRTQNDVYVRDLLNTDEFYLYENRVNLGDMYNYRSEYADTIPQVPMDYGTPDMWGWDNWVKNRKVDSKTPVADTNLYTRVPLPQAFRGCSSCRRPRKI